MFKYHHTSDSESYTTTHKGGSVLSVSTEQSNNLFNNTLNMLNNNDMDMKYASAIALALYVGFVAPRLSRNVSDMFNKCWFKMLFVLVVAYTANDNPPLSIILIVAYMMSLHTANQWQIIDMVKGSDMSDKLLNESEEKVVEEENKEEEVVDEDEAEKYFQSLLEGEQGDGLPAGSVAQPGPPDSAVQEAQHKVEPPKEEESTPEPMGAGSDDLGMFASV